jgi:adenine phosphoribosyltransferase
MSEQYDLDSVIRKVPDFPKPGILFYDITGVLVEPEAFRYCVSRIVEMYKDSGMNAVAGIDARGFVFGAPVAYELGLPLILIRKRGKLPGEKFVKRFTLEYGEDEIELHKADVAEARKVLLLDDLVATGGTLRAAAEMIVESGSEIAGVCCVVGLPFLNYGEFLKPFAVRTLIEYHSE